MGLAQIDVRGCGVAGSLNGGEVTAKLNGEVSRLVGSDPLMTDTDRSAWIIGEFGVALEGGHQATGSNTVKVVPRPSTLSTSICPPCASVMDLAIASPSPPILGDTIRNEGSPRVGGGGGRKVGGVWQASEAVV